MSWTLPALNNATSITLQRSTDGGTTWVTFETLSDPTATGAVDATPPPGPTQYRAIATNPVGAAPPATAPASVTAKPPIPPSPTGLAGYVDNSNVMQLSWTASPGADSYVVDREDISTGIWTTSTGTSTSTSYADSGHATGSGYRYRARAINVTGTSTFSGEFPAARYAVIDLGVGNSGDYVNDAGQVVLNAKSTNPLFWDQGVTNSIGDGGTHTFPSGYGVTGLNNAGTVVGQSYNTAASGDPRPLGVPFTWSKTGTFTALAMYTSAQAILPSYNTTQYEKTVGINDAGSVAGFTDEEKSPTYAAGSTYAPYPDGPYQGAMQGGVQWANLTAAPTLVSDSLFYDPSRVNCQPDGPNKVIFYPSAINNHNLVIGLTGTYVTHTYPSVGALAAGDYIQTGTGYDLDWPGATWKGAVWDGTAMSTLAGTPMALNNNNQIVGNATLDGTVVVWKLVSGTYTPTPIYGGPVNAPSTDVPVAINARTTLTGTTTSSAVQIISSTRIWEMDPTTGNFGLPLSISDLLPAGGGWNGVSAKGINNYGAIVGTASLTTTAGTTTHGVMLCPCAVVGYQSLTTYTVDMTNPVLNYVRFGLWDYAFSAITPPSPITGSLSTPTVNDGNAESANFVGSDSRRFYIRVYDPSATTSTVTADWYTQTSTGTVDDDGKGPSHTGVDTITLTRSSSNPAVYVSKALMLVADEVDNGQPTNTGLTGGGDANEGQADHRLRRAAIDDTMCYSYTPAASGSAKQTFSLPIFGGSEPVKNITVHFVETKTATHNTINTNDVPDMKVQMSARWAVAGIKLNYVYNTTTDVLDVTSTGVDLGNVDGSGLPGSQLYKIAQALRAKYGAYNSSDPTIWVVVVGEFSTSTGTGGGTRAGGLSFTDGLAAEELADGNITSLAQMNPILHCCFLAQLLGLSNPVAAPHELGHPLSDQIAADVGTDFNHYVGLNLGQNMMYWKANDIPQLVTDSKRLWNDTSHQTDPTSAAPPTGNNHTNQIDYMRLSPLCH